MSELPRLLGDFARPPGLIKHFAEDFEVEEVPLYEPGGTGTHTYFRIEKRGVSTMEAVHAIAAALDVRRRDIGYAGLKDAHAVTRQWMSIEHLPPERVQALELSHIRILEVDLHGNKLRLGHLAGNRFVIRVRQTEPHRLADFQDALRALCERGVPNYFGPQRFGGRGDTDRVGRAVVRGEIAEAVDLILGRPAPADDGAVLRARQHYEAGRFEEAARAWPWAFRDERRALRALQRARGRKKSAFFAIDKALRRFYVSAYQSWLFNAIAAQRLETGLGQLQTGDLAMRHGSRSVFLVEDAAVEQPRADAFEISPTGPLFGYRMSHPQGIPGTMEAQLLSNEELTDDSFRSGPQRVKGGRRVLRFRPEDASIRLGADDSGAYLELRFTLSRGCYATSLLRELFVGMGPEESEQDAENGGDHSEED